MDAHKNFAYSTVATAPSPAASGTSLVVAAAEGSRFPAAPFNATIWPVGAKPLPSNAEIVRVTTVSTDTLTIVRAQEGSSARTVVVGDQIAATVTAKVLTDAEQADGWQLDNETWTYATASTFTVVGDHTVRFKKGTRLKWTQTTVRYGVVVASSFGGGNTTVQIAVNDDYTIANAAISETYYSYAADPQGYPGWFNFTPSYTGFSVNPSGGVCKYAIFGNTCHFKHNRTDGTSNSTAFTISLPVAAQNTGGASSGLGGVGRMKNNGTFIVGYFECGASLACYNTVSGGTWTASGAKCAYIHAVYEF